MSNRASRQLIIALDAMEWSLVQRFMSEGKMPAFRRVMESGARARLRSTSEQLPDTVWSCIYTGTNPAKFAKYFYVQYDPSTGWLKNVPDDEIGGIPFWDQLSAAGRRVGVLDLPKFPLSSSLNGFQVTNWGAHATKTARASNPALLIDEIDRRFGRHPVGDCDKVDAKPAALRRLRDNILAGVRAHGEMFRWLMKEREWDTLIASFSAPHCIGHHFWQYQDAKHAAYDPNDPHGLRDSMESTYRAIDREVGEMLRLAGEGATCMIVSGHGMGPIYHASWNLPEMLELWGYGKPGALRTDAPRKKARVNPWRIVKMVVPGWIQYAIKNSLPKKYQDELLFLWYVGGKKFEDTPVFSVPNNDSVGAIRLNVKGRDKNGVIDPGDCDRIVADIVAALNELTDPETGRKIVACVTVAKAAFHGPYLHQLPDITVLWEQSFAWRDVQSPRFGRLTIRKQDGRTGSHTPTGFMLAAGPGIPAGVEVDGASTYDIAPTILALAGVPVPRNYDGRALAVVDSAARV